MHPLLPAVSVATAESITGGLIGAMITGIPGASEVYAGGVVCYATRIKEEVLGIPREITEGIGVVSGECAEAMAEGVRAKFGTRWAISTTGVAGPGPQGAIPPGTVWIGLAGPGGVEARKCTFVGDRDQVRHLAAREALAMLEFGVRAWEESVNR
ncbi:CinA family protein [Nocardioides sp. Bht2]|uniref:CinA family protein n=1 Tax=Nocardioides sp. Bht2 TaxID=3392297 RepID=UPI0039B4FBAD